MRNVKLLRVIITRVVRDFPEKKMWLNMVLFTSVDPVHFEEAVKSEKWRVAIDSEMKAIEKNNTWFLTDLPDGAKRIGVKRVYKMKLDKNGNVDKYKARLVVKEYTQQHGVDYTEVFASVARMDTVRLIIALAAQKGWVIYQLDVLIWTLSDWMREFY